MKSEGFFMLKPLFLVALAAVLLLGCTQSPAQATPGDAMAEKNAASPTPEAMEKTAAAGANQAGSARVQAAADEGDAMAKSSALAGGFYEPFTKARYDAAKAEGKTVFLEFYANWCPVCKQQEPQIESAFEKITDERVVGFRVNYNDDETDEEEKDLARQFGVSYQHTHVLLRADGTVQAKSLEFWDADRVVQEIMTVAG